MKNKNGSAIATASCHGFNSTQYRGLHIKEKKKACFCTLPYLVDLPIGAIPNQFDQLEDTGWVLGVKERQESGRLKREDKEDKEEKTRYSGELNCDSQLNRTEEAIQSGI